MSDVEWYVESAGIRTGPFSARDIVQKHLSGQIPGNAMATAARMQGDWVSISDLVEAFKELNPPKKTPAPVSPLAPSSLGDGPSFQAPPRPVEQLETSKIINLKQLREGDGPKDATESLFLAVQAIREKSAMKNAQAAAAQKDTWGELKRPTQKLPPQTSMLGALVLILIVTAWGASKFMSDDPAPVSDSPAGRPAPTEKNAVGNRPMAGGNAPGSSRGLLDAGGNPDARGAPNMPSYPNGGAMRLDSRRPPPVAGRPSYPSNSGGAVRAEDEQEIDQVEPESAEGDMGDQQGVMGRGKGGMGMDSVRGGQTGEEGDPYAPPIDENGRIAEPMHDSSEGVAPDSGSP